MKRKLITIGGLGVEKHERTNGIFEVRYSETRAFTLLSEAFFFYNQLNYPASLYDTTKTLFALR